ncbi:PASTA domain-containing protein [Microtetraspora sp. AC03309]|uniref:PASTA domain-containing protein n=1 Tax=Microtetraspora sp. AC03309 TaxID=2779376 RepID=UPI001E5AFA22|nr:PASTA domain-containing protein [Microtetraspora sp. AC03309]MCC5581364.1 PASTA domain-containing protein [Microtetraspora sp. AC03309]
MNVEEVLKEAMTSRVAGVQAPPTMGQRIRRRNRSHVVRFRTAGAALLTVAVAGAVPVYLSSTSAPVAAPVGAPGGTSEPVGDDHALSGNVVPDVVGMTNDTVREVLEAAGFKVAWRKVIHEERAPGTIITQQPAAGTVAPEGSTVEITMATSGGPQPKESGQPTPTPSSEAPMPQDLGDLGDGRTFGGAHFGYLPDGLVWGKWSGKDGFGRTSYTTTWVEPGRTGTGEYSVQAVVYKGKAARDRRGFAKGDPVMIHGKRGFLGPLTEGGDVAGSSPETTLTLVWFDRENLAVEIMFSPTFAEKLGGDAAAAEIQKIAEGVAVKN